MKTTRVCIKVANLRKLGYESLREWLDDPDNIYVGRGGRIFIDKKIFHYPGSKWANPYKLTDFSREQCILMFAEHLCSSGLLKDVKELRGMNLGCFCDEGEMMCHGQVLADLANKKR